MIVFTSDHGDYLGDHWLGEKDLFHEPSREGAADRLRSVRRGRRGARHGLRRTRRGDRSRADLSSRRSAAIRPRSRIGSKGRSLMPFLHGEKPANWRRLRDQRIRLFASRPRLSKLGSRAARRAPVHGGDKRWKYMHCDRLPADAVRHGERSAGAARSRRRPGFRGATRAHGRRAVSTGRCATRSARPLPEAKCDNMRGRSMRRGILVGVWDERELPEELWSRYRGAERLTPTRRRDNPEAEMLSEAKNRLLTQVGPGTPMGDYLRRYWFPIAATAEFDDKDVKPIRLLGEDLTLYKDLSGTFGLVDRHCPHRRADLSYGYRREDGPALQLPRLAHGRDRRLHRAALRGHGEPEQQAEGALLHQGLSRCAKCAGSCGPTWARSRRRNCRSTRRSRGTTASSRS